MGTHGIQGGRQLVFHRRGILPLRESRAVDGDDDARQSFTRVDDAQVDDGGARGAGLGKQKLTQGLITPGR